MVWLCLSRDSVNCPSLNIIWHTKIFFNGVDLIGCYYKHKIWLIPCALPPKCMHHLVAVISYQSPVSSSSLLPLMFIVMIRMLHFHFCISFGHSRNSSEKYFIGGARIIREAMTSQSKSESFIDQNAEK